MNDAGIFFTTMPFFVILGCCAFCCYTRQRRNEQEEFVWRSISSHAVQIPSAPPAEPTYTYAILPTVPEEEEPSNTV